MESKSSSEPVDDDIRRRIEEANSSIGKKKRILPFELGDVTEANIEQLRILNIKTLPVRYSDKFYSELIKNYGTEYMQFAFYNGFVAGGGKS